MNNIAKSIAIWLVVALVMMTMFNQFTGQSKVDNQIVYSQFMQDVKEGKIASVSVEGRVISGETQNKEKFTTYSPGYFGDLWMVNDLLKYNVKVEAKPDKERSMITEMFISILPILFIMAVFMYFMRQMQGGGKGGGHAQDDSAPTAAPSAHRTAM